MVTRAEISGPSMADFLDLPAVASPEANAAQTDMLRALQDALRAPASDHATLADAMARALAAFDRFTAHVVTAHPMTCAAGCTACCHDDPRGVSGVELWWLGQAVDALPDGDAVRARFAAYAAEHTDPETWRRLRRPCPLLDEAGRCRAYDRRPLACRAFWALTPAAWCDPGHADYARRTNPHLDPAPVLVQLLQVLSRRAGWPKATDLHGGMAARLG